MIDSPRPAVPFTTPVLTRPGDGALRVVIVGGGVAALEAALCLRETAGELVSTTIVAPNPEFVYTPMAVQEPFDRPLAPRYELAEIARDAGAELCVDAFTWSDSEFFVAHTRGGEQLRYDALLLAPGASVYSDLRYTITLVPHRIDEQMHGVLQDVEGRYISRLAFVIPDGPVWPLPIYELALMTAARARDVSAELAVTIVTPEPAPLAIFGEAVSERVERLLDQAGIVTMTSTRSAVHGPGLIAMHPGNREISADRVIALPQLFGPRCPGIPARAGRGFISTDGQGRVPGLNRTWAVGDATDFPIKFGGIAAHQADIAAQSIAALAGADVVPEQFRPQLRAVLLTGEQPLRISAELGVEGPTRSEVVEAQASDQPPKIAARYLASCLDRIDGARSAAAKY